MQKRLRLSRWQPIPAKSHKPEFELDASNGSCKPGVTDAARCMNGGIYDKNDEDA